MAFVLGTRSREQLKGVHPSLVKLVEEAIKMTPQDFGVHSGVRTAREQKILFEKRATKKDGVRNKSKHQVQADGFGHAVDLVPWVGNFRWEWPLIYPIAGVMGLLSVRMGVSIRFGGVWDRRMSDYIRGDMSIGQAAAAVQREVHAYCVRNPGPDFIDGPHYEL
jgi:peptidoglycan L-alanyl-D-glutamate endopeptidase CwlK